MGLNLSAQSIESVLPGNVEETISQLRDRAGELDGRLRASVREHPFLTLFGAVAGGYLLGRLIAKR